MLPLSKQTIQILIGKINSRIELGFVRFLRSLYLAVEMRRSSMFKLLPMVARQTTYCRCLRNEIAVIGL
jgi:hypothetical protein